MSPLSIAPAFLQLSTLSDAQEQTRLRLISQLRRAQRANKRQQEYYEGARQVRDLGIAIPPHLTAVESVIAWPETVCDVISEQNQWRGWDTNVDLGLADVYADNHMQVEVGQVVLDALIYGLSYLTVGTGDPDEDEPDVLVTPGSPNRMTGTWNARTRRLSDALSMIYDERGVESGWQLYFPNETVTVERQNGQMVVTRRDQHGKNRVPVAVLRNRPRSDRPDGRSEITRAVRSHTDNGMRTILGLEVSREFYGAPQRALMGADESMFVDEDGNRVGQWAAVMGKMLMIPRDENGDLPTATTFQGASPQPYTEILKTLTQLVSSASGVPGHHLGFATDNPSSADAISLSNGRINKRTKDRQNQFNLGLVETGNLSYLWREGELPPKRSILSYWDSVETVSPGASADRAVKMISAGVLDPTSDFTLEQFGLTDQEIRRFQQERRRNSGSAALRAISQAAANGQPAVTLQTPVTDATNPPA